MTAQPSPLSRFQLCDSPPATPGKCAVCGSPNKPVIDFGLNIDYYGGVFLCVGCLAEAAGVIDMVHRSELDEAKAEAEQSLIENLDARDLVGVHREWYDAFIDIVDSFYPSTYNSDVRSDDETTDSAGEEVSDDSDNTDGKPTESDSATSEPSGQDDKPTRKRGRSNVPANSGNESATEFTGFNL